jgi:hypothetical protein
MQGTGGNAAERGVNHYFVRISLNNNGRKMKSVNIKMNNVTI